jgi:hypothetical protein
MVAYNASAHRAAQASEFARSARAVANHMEENLLAPLGSLHAVRALRLATPHSILVYDPIFDGDTTPATARLVIWLRNVSRAAKR